MDNKNGLLRTYGQFWSKSFDFKSRTPRREFWLAIAGNAIVYIISLFVFGIMGAVAAVLLNMEAEESSKVIAWVAMLVYPVACLISSLSMWTRRAHDSGKKGILIIPSVIAYFISSNVLTVSSVVFMVSGFVALFESDAYPFVAGSLVAFVISGIVCVLSLVYLAIVAFTPSGPDNEFGPNPYGQL